MILSAAAIYFWNHMANRKLHFTHIFQYQEQVLYHILPAKKRIKMQGIVWMYSQIQSYMNANHLKLYLLKLFYSLIYIFEVFIFFFLSLACYNVISKRTNPLHLFVFFCHTTQHAELLQTGTEPASLHRKHSALTTGLPEKSKLLPINHGQRTEQHLHHRTPTYVQWRTLCADFRTRTKESFLMEVSLPFLF